MSDSVWLHGRQPTRLLRPWDSPGKNTGVGCHFLLQCMKVESESEVLNRVWLPVTPWTAAYQAPPSMGFSRQQYWSGVPLHMLIRKCIFLLMKNTNHHRSLSTSHKLFCNSNIKDYWSQITIASRIIMEKFEMWELSKCDTEERNEQMLLEKWHP